MIVLGIDPGMANCGFAVAQTGRLLKGGLAVRDLGVLQTPKKGRTILERLTELEHDFAELLEQHEPEVVVAEAPSFPRSSRAAQMLGLSFGLLVGLCHGRARLVVRTATEWRELLGLPKVPRGAVGKKLRKASTAKLVHERFPGASKLLASTRGGLHEHALDALAIACTWNDRATRVISMPTRRAA